MKRRISEMVAFFLIGLAGLITLTALGIIIGHILIRGLGHVNLAFLTQFPEQMGRAGGILPAIMGTLVLTGLSLLLAIPVGVATAVYLSEYTRGGPVVRCIRFAVESLAGIPSILYGLFGFAFLVTFAGFGFSVLAGAITLALMLLPIIIRAGEEALRVIPQDYRRASLALGATRWQTTSQVVLPAALPGLVTGIMLATGRAVGETAAVWLTAGGALRIPLSPFDPARPMTVHLFFLASEGLSLERAYATAAVLLIMVMIIYFVSFGASRRYGAGRS